MLSVHIGSVWFAGFRKWVCVFYFSSGKSKLTMTGKILHINMKTPFEPGWRGAMVIATASGSEDRGFESRKGKRFSVLTHMYIAVLLFLN
jgi:hypothetical protein